MPMRKRRLELTLLIAVANLIAYAQNLGAAEYCSAVYNGRKWCYLTGANWSPRLLGTINQFVNPFAVQFYYYENGQGPFFVDSSEFPNPVAVVLGGSLNNNLCDCSGGGVEDELPFIMQKNPNTGNTDGWAFVDFRSGCSNGLAFGQNPQFKIWDLELDHYFLVQAPTIIASNDAVDNNGRLAGETGWNPNGTCQCSLADATYHTYTIKSGLASLCSDLDGMDNTDPSDAVLITPCIKHGTTCTRQQ